LAGLGDRILVLDNDGGTNGSALLFEVTRLTGERRVVSDFGLASQGVLGVDPQSVVALPTILGLGNSVLVVDSSGGEDVLEEGYGFGALVELDLNYGYRTIFHDFFDEGWNPHGIAVKPSLLNLGNQILVIDNAAGTNDGGALFSIDPYTQERKLLIDLGATPDPALGNAPCHIAVLP